MWDMKQVQGTSQHAYALSTFTPATIARAATMRSAHYACAWWWGCAAAAAHADHALVMETSRMPATPSTSRSALQVPHLLSRGCR